MCDIGKWSDRVRLCRCMFSVRTSVFASEHLVTAAHIVLCMQIMCGNRLLLCDLSISVTHDDLSKSFFQICDILDRHRIAMISEATVISYPSSLGTPLTFPPSPSVTNGVDGHSYRHIFHTIFLDQYSNHFDKCDCRSWPPVSQKLQLRIVQKSPVK